MILRERRRVGLRLIAGLLAATLLLAACGGDGDESASCTIAQSDLGPFGPNARLGRTVDEDAARAQMERDNVAEFIEITAVGPWDDVWAGATQRFGNGIHQTLSWVDVGGELQGLFEDGDAYAFDDLRVSRSFQGKIEHDPTPIYLPVAVGQEANFDASCVITSIEIGDEETPRLADLVDEFVEG